MIERWRAYEVQPGVFRIVTIAEPSFAAHLSAPLHSETTLFPPPPDGRLRMFTLLVVPGATEWTTSGTTPLPMGPIHLPSGQAAWLVGAERPVPDALLPDLKRARSIRVHDKDDTRLTSIRTLVVGVDGDGVGT